MTAQELLNETHKLGAFIANFERARKLLEGAAGYESRASELRAEIAALEATRKQAQQETEGALSQRAFLVERVAASENAALERERRVSAAEQRLAEIEQLLATKKSDVEGLVARERELLGRIVDIQQILNRASA